MAMSIEFVPWYKVANDILRCDGVDGCGALVLSDDAEKHLAWHKRVQPEPVPQSVSQPTARRTTMADLMCDDPDCSYADVPHRKHKRVDPSKT